MAVSHTDQEIQDTVRRSLDADSRLTDSLEIQVAVHNGVVTLTGTVPNDGQKTAAEGDARAAPGVVDVINAIVAEPLTRRSDGQIERDVCRALDTDPGINVANITMSVVDGVVYLRGSVPIYNQVARASEDAWSVPGVRDVVSELTVIPRSSALAEESAPTVLIRWAKLSSLLAILAGGWEVLSPFVLGYANLTIPTITGIVVGGLVMLLAAIRFFEVSRTASLGWVIALLGLWLVVAPFVFGYLSVPAPTTNDVAMGVVIFALGVWAALSTVPTSTP